MEVASEEAAKAPKASFNGLAKRFTDDEVIRQCCLRDGTLFTWPSAKTSGSSRWTRGRAEAARRSHSRRAMSSLEGKINAYKS